jgi:TonB family protein
MPDGMGVPTAPKILYKIEPEYSEAARQAKFQGTVVLKVDVMPDGTAQNISVQRSLGLGLDEKAIEAVRKWRFRPGTKFRPETRDLEPVTVTCAIEVNFRLLADPPATASAPAGQAVAGQAVPDNGVFRVGGGVTAPTLLQKIEPEYTEEARLAGYDGTAILYVEIGTDGFPQNIKVTRGLGLGLDEKAIEAVSKWLFTPGTRFGVPVTVAATIEVNFRLL